MISQMESSIPWIEKYRPAHINDVILDDQIRAQIGIFLQDRSDIHLIITGLPGIGKTTTVRCIARELMGDQLVNGYLELNAAEDRGVRSIASIIPPFCKKVNICGTSKIILLDEADNMTAKCQYDICDMIKEFGKKTKFIFTCNEFHKIIEDLQSISHIIRFKKLSTEQITRYLRNICEKEKLVYMPSGLESICYVSDGDMRKAINNLQLTAFSYQKINKQTVFKVCKLPDPEDIKRIIQFVLNTKLVEANTEIENIIADGYYYSDIVTGFNYVMSEYNIDTDLKLRLIDVINQTKIVISTGLRSRLQLTAMLCRMIMVVMP